MDKDTGHSGHSDESPKASSGSPGSESQGVAGRHSVQQKVEDELKAIKERAAAIKSRNSQRTGADFTPFQAPPLNFNDIFRAATAEFVDAKKITASPATADNTPPACETTKATCVHSPAYEPPASPAKSSTCAETSSGNVSSASCAATLASSCAQRTETKPTTLCRPQQGHQDGLAPRHPAFGGTQPPCFAMIRAQGALQGGGKSRVCCESPPVRCPPPLQSPCSPTLAPLNCPMPRTPSARHGLRSKPSVIPPEINIAEVDREGKYVCIANTSQTKDEEIGCNVLRQLVRGQPVVEFHFPPRVTLKSQNCVWVWAGHKAPKNCSPEQNFSFPELNTWGTGSDYNTALFKPNGQMIASSAPQSLKPDRPPDDKKPAPGCVTKLSRPMKQQLTFETPVSRRPMKPCGCSITSGKLSRGCGVLCDKCQGPERFTPRVINNVCSIMKTQSRTGRC